MYGDFCTLFRKNLAKYKLYGKIARDILCARRRVKQ